MLSIILTVFLSLALVTPVWAIKGCVPGSTEKCPCSAYPKVKDCIDKWKPPAPVVVTPPPAPAPAPAPTPTPTPTPTPVPATTFKVGAKVQVVGIAKLNVRTCPAGAIVGTQSSGATGVIVGGTGASVGGFHRWQINYATGTDGCSAQEYLKVIP